MYITVFITETPVEVISFLLDVIQTTIAILNFSCEEVFPMVNSILVVSGTHGVVQILIG